MAPLKITTVSYKRSVTLNVGDFESIRVEAGAVAEVEDGDSPDDVWDKLREAVGEEIAHDARTIRQRQKHRDSKREG